MSFDEFLKATWSRYDGTGDYAGIGNERYGQAFFNCLYTFRPDLSEQIRGTELDPFYTSVSPELIVFLYERW